MCSTFICRTRLGTADCRIRMHCGQSHSRFVLCSVRAVTANICVSLYWGSSEEWYRIWRVVLVAGRVCFPGVEVRLVSVRGGDSCFAPAGTWDGNASSAQSWKELDVRNRAASRITLRVQVSLGVDSHFHRRHYADRIIPSTMKLLRKHNTVLGP
jgi:hypothetical protein